MITEQQQCLLDNDQTGLATYELMANNIDTIEADLPALIDNMSRVDHSGQFTASAARYLHAINAERYADQVRRLVAATIDRDRERRYLSGLMDSIYGPDAANHADELSAVDNNFRRLYKRLYLKA